ncbi:hypothetical protein RCC89_04055 [Cytophagaceae bacterium ABcell3]|nr:hypothetical protein RCC89_04055 [Cytophagaceae bacterium ABcell3]
MNEKDTYLTDIIARISLLQREINQASVNKNYPVVQVKELELEKLNARLHAIANKGFCCAVPYKMEDNYCLALKFYGISEKTPLLNRRFDTLKDAESVADTINDFLHINPESRKAILDSDSE